MGAADKRPRLPRKRPMPDVAPPVGHRGRGTMISALARRVSAGRSAAKLHRSAAMTGQSIQRPSADSGWLAVDALEEWRARFEAGLAGRFTPGARRQRSNGS